jgi:transcriptional regulator with XRE-family HTH domain
MRRPTLKALRMARADAGLTISELAKRASVSRDTISNAERGQHSLQATTLHKVAQALGRAPSELLAEEEKLTPKAESRSSLEPSLFNGLEDERRELRLSEVADELLLLGLHLLLTWESELPDRARGNDDEWLGNIVATWRMFGKINYDVLEELGADGLRDKQGWLARYMDVNAAIHRINAAIQEHSAAGTSPAEEAAVMLEPLMVA